MTRKANRGAPGDPRNGEYTQEETASAIGVKVRQLRRIEQAAIAKFIARVEQLEHADIGKVRAILAAKNLSTENAAISAPACPGDPALRAGSKHAPRAAKHPADAPIVERRAGLLSITKGQTMKTPNPNLLCLLADARTRVHVAEADVSKLIAIAGAGDRARFESELARVEASAPAHTVDTEPDAYELHKHNPELGWCMKHAGVTAADLRKHGPTTSTSTRVLPNLRELAQATATRESRGPAGDPKFIVIDGTKG